VVSWSSRYDFYSVEGVPVRRSAVDAGTRPAESYGSARRKAVAVAAIAAVVLGAAYAIYRQRHAFGDALQRVGVWPMLLSLAVGAAGTAATFPLWREVLGGLGVWLPWGQGARVFFTSQLGKYLPGAVWPLVMQMEAGRAHGASRRTMLAGNLLTIVLSCCVGLLVACVALPVWSAHALTHYWWVLLALPFLLALLHPRALPALLDRAFAVVGRQPLREQLPLRSTVRAGMWSALSWLLLGTHVYVLCAALGHTGFSAFALSVGGMALAVSAGVLLIPVPAGAGLREVVLLLVLRSILSNGQALAVVIGSRVLLIVADLLLAGLAAAPRAVRSMLTRERH
jgi:glycosyltransferase 2 family protein